MDAVLRRLPDAQAVRRRLPALAGFAFGVAIMVYAGLFASTLYTGRGFNVPPAQVTPVYPNL
jgi:hypothetical protein